LRSALNCKLSNAQFSHQNFPAMSFSLFKLTLSIRPKQLQNVHQDNCILQIHITKYIGPNQFQQQMGSSHAKIGVVLTDPLVEVLDFHGRSSPRERSRPVVGHGSIKTIARRLPSLHKLHTLDLSGEVGVYVCLWV
jgi:hypothetical protein